LYFDLEIIGTVISFSSFSIIFVATEVSVIVMLLGVIFSFSVSTFFSVLFWLSIFSISALALTKLSINGSLG